MELSDLCTYIRKVLVLEYPQPTYKQPAAAPLIEGVASDMAAT